jgi:hypothetical protein
MQEGTTRPRRYSSTCLVTNDRLHARLLGIAAKARQVLRTLERGPHPTVIHPAAMKNSSPHCTGYALKLLCPPPLHHHRAPSPSPVLPRLRYSTRHLLSPLSSLFSSFPKGTVLPSCHRRIVSFCCSKRPLRPPASPSRPLHHFSVPLFTSGQFSHARQHQRLPPKDKTPQLTTLYFLRPAPCTHPQRFISLDLQLRKYTKFSISPSAYLKHHSRRRHGRYCWLPSCQRRFYP